MSRCKPVKIKGIKIKTSNQVLISSWLTVKLIKAYEVDKDNLSGAGRFLNIILKLKKVDRPIKPNFNKVER